MMGRTRNDRAALDRLADTLVEDILQASDADLLAEAEASDEGGAGMARAAFNRAVTAWRRRRTPPVKRSGRSRTRPGIRALDPNAARRWLQEFITGDPETASKLVATAAKGGRLSDEDVYGMLERLAEKLLQRLQERNAHEGRPDRR